MNIQATADRRDSLTIVLWVFLGGVFLCAAVTKAYTVSQFASVLDHLFPVDLPIAKSVASMVVIGEALLGGVMIAGVGGRRTLALSFATLIVFSLTLIYLSLSPSPRPCGCFGLVKSSMGPREDTTSGLVRNGALLIVNGWLLIRCGVRFGSSGAPGSVSRGHGNGVRAGFTLIEMLLVIGVIALIIAISLPALSKSRKQAKVTVSLATHQQLVIAINTYASSSKDFFPYVGTPGNPMGPLVINGYDELSSPGGGLSYFRANSRLWLSLLHPAYLNSKRSVTDDGTRENDSLNEYPEGVFTTQFRIAHGCSASAQYWDTDDAPIDDTLLRGSTLGDVRFPSHKGLTWDAGSGKYLNKEGDDSIALYTAGRADGSAGLIDIANPPADLPVSRPYGAIPFPVLSTRHGLAGRDF
ncbi:MAG: type II secretion system protein [Tepidisphaera sp.]